MTELKVKDPAYTRLYEQLLRYKPYNEQEERDRAVMLGLLEEQDRLYSRSNLLCHMTASGWVVNPARNRVLMAYHNLYDSWAWLGGHADGETDLLAVAMKEVREESGLTCLKAVTEEIYSLEILTVDGHIKKGQYVPSHLHLNITYLIEADDRQAVRAKEDENSAVAWFSPEEAIARSCEPWFRENIYAKLNAQLDRY